MEVNAEQAKSAEKLRKYHIDSSLTGASSSPLLEHPLPLPSPDVVFNKAKRIPLPYAHEALKINEISYEELMSGEIKGNKAARVTLQSISCFLLHACGVTSLKLAQLQAGGELYTVRANPSSGGLHPSEVYLMLPPGLIEGEPHALVVHYLAVDHALQIRATIDKAIWNELKLENSVIMCGTSLYWREVFKYGLRGFRYSLLDAGHLLGAAAVSAKLLSWHSTFLTPTAGLYDSLFGLNRKSDFPNMEIHDPQFILVVGPNKQQVGGVLQSLHKMSAQVSKFSWSGATLPCSKEYHDATMHEVLDFATCTTFPADKSPASEPGTWTGKEGASAPINTKTLASEIIMKRRSAQDFLAQKFKGGELSKVEFYRMLERTVPSSNCQIWKNMLVYQKMDSVWLVVYVHRVEGLKQGLYVLFRQRLTASEALGRAQNFQNAINLPSRACEKVAVSQPPGCPNNLHLYMLVSGVLSQYAAKISASQSLCGNGSFLASMMADIPHEIQQGNSRYRMLHLEAGIVGQLLYLEATAIGKGASGVGAFYDDAANSIFAGTAKTLYHFAVGKPTEDQRISVHVSKMMKKSISAPAPLQIVAATCVCGKAAPHLCARCKGIKYCSQNCQKSHWSKHKTACVLPPTSFSEVGELMRNFTPKKHIQIFKNEALDTTSLVEPPKNTHTRGRSVPFEELPEKPSSDKLGSLLSTLMLVEKSGILDGVKTGFIHPQELFRCASLVPIPESTKETGEVPVEYFQHLLASQPLTDTSRYYSQLLYFKAIPEMQKVGVSLDPALRKPAPSNPTPKQLFERFKTLYEIVQLLTLSTTMRIDSWESFASRAQAFNQMGEYELAWQDCMRCVSLVKTGFTSCPPPNKFEYEVVTWTEQLATQLESKWNSPQIHIVTSAEELAEIFMGTSISSNMNDSELKKGRTSEVFSKGRSWNLGISDQNSKTDEFLATLDRIPGIKTDAHGKRREWRKFPAIMKNNYLNFTSHPTDPKDPRVAAWEYTLQWLEDQYLSNLNKPLTVDFLLELNTKCGANDGVAFQYEREVWGVNDGPLVASLPPSSGFRKFASWMQNGNPRAPSPREAKLLAELDEKLQSPLKTQPNFVEQLSAEQRALLTEFYHETTRPKDIQNDIQEFVDLANSENFKKLHPVQRAAILGLRLVAIHPFDDSNGRTQQLLMSLELMREGYPPIVRRELPSFYTYLHHDIRGLKKDPNCEVFTRWCAVNVALALVGSDASESQIRSYAENIFVHKLPFDNLWCDGHLSLTPPVELNASAITGQDAEPTNNFKEPWLYAHFAKAKGTKRMGDANALPQGINHKLTMEEIDELATKNSILFGKWILEVAEEHINTMWQCVAKAVRSGALPRSSSAKTSTAFGFGVPPHFRAHYVVCVYTENYLDTKDVMEAAADLYNLLVGAGMRKGIGSIRYKPDIYTHLGFYGMPNDPVEEWRYTYNDL